MPNKQVGSEDLLVYLLRETDWRTGGASPRVTDLLGGLTFGVAHQHSPLFPLARKSLLSEESPSLRLSRAQQGGKTGGRPWLWSRGGEQRKVHVGRWFGVLAQLVERLNGIFRLPETDLV